MSIDLDIAIPDADELRTAGLCAGSEADLACASALFAGPSPWLADFF